MTHVDVIPPQRENGTAITKQLADDGRKDDGNLRFEAVIQTNGRTTSRSSSCGATARPPRRTAWRPHTRAFREKLGPASGALYDERFYKVLE